MLLKKINLDNYWRKPEFRTIYVESSDSVTIFLGRYLPDNNGRTYSPHTYNEVTLRSGEINRYDLQRQSLFGIKKVSYHWKPDHTMIDPLQEAALQDMLSKGQITSEQAESTREALISKSQTKSLLKRMTGR